MRAINIAGLKVKTFTVIKRIVSPRNNPRWLCVCECGEFRTALKGLLVRGVISCNCHIRKTSRPLFRIWSGMMQRCYNVKLPGYKNYGGRGIKVDMRWHDFFAFENDMGVRPKGKSLDRIDNNGDYSKENCKWSTQIEQSNNIRKNILLTHDGLTMSMSEWARHLNITREAMRLRISKNYSKERLFTRGKLSTK